MIIGYVIWGDQFQSYIEGYFSILTFLGDPSVERVCVLTSHPERFAPLREKIELVHVPDERFLEWEAGGGYRFRRKIMGVRELAQRFSGRDLLFVDADTFRATDLGSIDRDLKAGKVFMHEGYGPMCQAVSKMEQDLWSRIKGREIRGERMDDTRAHWNSGTLGLPGAKAERIIQRALEMSDELQKHLDVGKHFTAEELAFSLSCQMEGEVNETSSHIGHYWGNKAEWTAYIEKFLARSRLLGQDAEAQIGSVVPEDFRTMPIRSAVPRRRKRIDAWLDRVLPLKSIRYFGEPPR